MLGGSDRYVEDVLQLIGDVGLSPFAGKMT